MDTRLLLIPFALQATCMIGDEFYFHRKRALPRWERLGHPLDTLTVLLCWAVVLFAAPTRVAVTAYVGLSVFSCLFVTKDEWVHATHCRGGEHWLHAILFILHPMTFLSAGILWQSNHAAIAPARAGGGVHDDGFVQWFFLANAVLTLFFGTYQLVYWNLLWKDASTAPSTTKSTTS